MPPKLAQRLVSKQSSRRRKKTYEGILVRVVVLLQIKRGDSILITMGWLVFNIGMSEKLPWIRLNDGVEDAALQTGGTKTFGVTMFCSF